MKGALEEKEEEKQKLIFQEQQEAKPFFNLTNFLFHVFNLYVPIKA